MEFEELQKVWLAEKQETVYAIDEKALHNRVSSKKNTILHIANVSELLLIIVNFCAGGFILCVSIRASGNIFLGIMAVWMLLTSVYVIVSRTRRLNELPRFDRSMREELQHAVATASYQVRLSLLMRLNVLPVGVLSILSVWDADKPVWLIVGMSVFFVIVFYLSGWEHNIYRNKKRELVLLQAKLER
jgi:hypothetical protein